MTQNSDLESIGRHKNKICQHVQDSGENFPKLIATSSNQNNHRRENLVDFEQSDDDGYDTCTQAFSMKKVQAVSTSVDFLIKIE